MAVRRESVPKLFGIYALLLQLPELLHNNGLVILMRYAEPSVVRGFNMHPHLAHLYCAANGNGQQILVLHGVLFKAGGYVGAEIIVQNINMLFEKPQQFMDTVVPLGMAMVVPSSSVATAPQSARAMRIRSTIEVR